MIPAEADAFQHRGVVNALEEAAAAAGTAVLGQVLSGTGGVGKTQLAAHYARRSWKTEAVDLLVWVTAASRAAVVSGYAQAGVEVVGAEPSEPERAAAHFVSWLETTNRRWLIILDDLGDPADLRGLWPPRNPAGRVVITTRRRDAALTAQGRRLIDVGLFTEAEAAGYLAARLNAYGRSEPAHELAGLAQDLGYLPLALAQAATYLLDLDLDVDAYRRRLADRRRTLADLVPDESSLPDEQRVTMAATWSLSLERADRLRPIGLARPMLELASILDPNGIPQSILTAQPALTYLATYRTPITGPKDRQDNEEVSGDEAADALRCLHRLSLIEHAPERFQGAVRVHNLVQRAAREQLSERRREVLLRAAAGALLAAWPKVQRNTALAQSLRANTEALAKHAGAALWQPEIHPVLFRSGKSFGEAGLITAASSYWQHLHTTSLNELGPDHPNTLATRHNVAYWRAEAGDVVGAITAFEQLLQDRLRVFGPDHPETLATRHNLAYWRGEAGDAAGAATAFEQVLQDALRVLGPDHPDTLTTRHNLALWRGRAGDAAGAVTAFEQIVQDRLRVLGPDHPDTLISRANIARWRGEAGDAAGAATAYEQVLQDFLRVLGPDHPHTLTARHNQASSRGQAGDAAGAASAYEQLLQDRLRVLGPDHPSTLATRANLAHWRGEAGDAAGAATAYEQLLQDRLRVLGPDHPDTLATRQHLALWRGRSTKPSP